MTKDFLHRLTLVVVIVCFLIAISACTQQPAAATPAPAKATAQPAAATQPAAKPSSVTEQPAVATPPPTNATTPAAATRVPDKQSQTPRKPTGTLRVAIGSFAQDSVDPMLQGSPALINTILPMYDTLVGAGSDGRPGPGVAERWEMSSDGLAWTFYIRKGLNLHDNQGEVTAEDVKFSIERVLSPQSTSRFAGTLSKDIKSIDVVDRYTVRVRTNSLQLDLPFSLSSLSSIEGAIVPKRYIEEKGVENFRAHPIGSGPWKLVQHAAGNKYEYQAVSDPEFYKNHYRPMPAFDRLIISMVPEEGTRTAMLQTGEADIADVSPEKATELQKANLRLGEAPIAYQLNLHLWDTYQPEVAKMPVANKQIRQALSLAINREEVVKYLFQGYGDAATLPPRLFPFVMDIDPEYWRTYSQKAYRYDAQEAKRLLTEAHYDGSEVPFYSYAQAGVPVGPKLADAIAGYWAAVGVKTKMMPVEFGVHSAMRNTKPHNPKIFGTAAISQAPVRYLATSSLDLSYGSKGSIGLLEDPQLDKLIASLSHEPNETKRRDLMKQVVQMASDTMVLIPLVYGSGLYGLSANIGEWKAIPGTGYVLGLTYETTTARSR